MVDLWYFNSMLGCEEWFLKSLALGVLKLVMKYGRCQMKIFTPLAIAAAFAAVVGLSAPALAQNAKVAAATSTLTALSSGNSWFDVNGMSMDVRVSQQTSLSFDVALQCSLATDTTVKTKGGKRASATAEAGVKVRVRIEHLDDGEVDGAAWYAQPSADIGADPDDPDAPDSGVTYCQRSQTLEAVLQGQIDLTTCVDSEGNFDPTACTLTDEEIRLILSTLSAHAFNFFDYNLTSGDYRLTVEANPATGTAINDEEGADSSAAAVALVGLGTMVVDEVRFGAIPN